jgi:hypothetical protein
MNSQLFIIDKILNIEVDHSKHFNEINALEQLRTGLLALYNTVKPVENKIMVENPNSLIISFGNDPNLPQEINHLLPCFFHWFGNSIINYARLVGLIVAKEQGEITEGDLQFEPAREKIRIACNNYIKSLPELEEVLKWRHKVSAHFALTDPRKEDNIATLEASIIYPVGSENGRYRTGTLTFSKGDNKVNYNSEIPKWSLTETFEILENRFWTVRRR